MGRRLNVRFLLLVTVAAALIGVGWFGLYRYQTGRRLGEYLTQAARAEEEGKRDRALRLLRAYIAQAPADVTARVRYAELVEKGPTSRRGLADALDAHEAVARLAPDRLEHRRKCAQLALDLARLDAADEHLLALESARPGDAQVARLRGIYFEQKSRFEEAAAAYEASRAADPTPETAARLAALYRKKLGRPADADRVLDELVIRRPADPAAYTTRAAYARVFARDTRLEAAAADVAKARSLDPASAEVLLLSADVAMDRADRDLVKRDEHLRYAREALVSGIARHPALARLHLALADAEGRAGKREEALRVVREALPKVPQSSRPEVLFAVAERAADAGDTRAADDALRELRTLKQDPARIDFATARVLAVQGRWFDAAGAIERARPLLVADPARALQADLLLASAYGHTGDTDRQVTVYLRAANAAPLDPRPRLGLAAAYAALGRSAEAAAEYERVTGMPDAPAGAWLALARLRVSQALTRPPGDRQWAQVEALLDAAGRAAPDSPEVPLLRAESRYAQGDPAGAAEVLKKAREAKAAPELWFALAVLTDRGGDNAAAAGVLDEAERRFGDSVDLRLARLRVTPYQNAVQAAAALDRLAAGAERFPEADRARLLRAIAGAYWLVGRPVEAGRLWEAVSRLRPDELAVRVLLFDVALRADDEAGMVRVLDELRRIEGDGPLGQYGRATLLIWKGRRGDPSGLAEARRLLQSAAVRRRGWARVPLAVAQIDELEGEPGRALESLALAVQHGDRQPVTVRRLVQLLYERQRYKEADEVIRQLQAQAPLTTDLARLGAELSLQNLDPDRALELGRQAVRPDSKDPRDRIWLGQLLAAAHKAEEAEAEFEAALALAPDDPDPVVALVQYHTRRKDAAKADAAIRRAEARAVAGDRWALGLARCYDLAGRREEAGAKYRAAVAASPREPRVLRAAAEFHLQGGATGPAEPLLRALLSPDARAAAADAAWARRSLALALGFRGDDGSLAEALALLDANRAAGETGEDLRARGVLLSARPTRRREAIAAFERAEKLSPPRPDHEFILARLYEAAGEWGKARDRLLRLIGLEGQNDGFVAALTSSLIRRGELGEAGVWAGQLLDRAPHSSTAVRLQAKVWLAQGKAADAGGLVRAYAEARDGDPADPAARALAAAGLMEEVCRARGGGGFAADAELYYTRHRDLSKRPEASLPLAAFLGRSGQTARALAECDRAAAAGVPPAAVALAAASAIGEGSDEAHLKRVDELLGKAADGRDAAAEVRFALATLRERQGRYGDAERLYGEVLRENPAHLGALNNLATLLALTGRAADGVVVAERAVAAAAPPPAEVLDTRGLAFLAAGRLDDARRDLDAAATRGDAPAVVHYHRAVVRLKQGDRGQAADAWRAATDRGFRPADLHPLERPAHEELVARLGKN